MACTRPGGTVRVSVFARPNFRRRPSGDWVTVKLKYLMNSANDDDDRQAAGDERDPEAAPAAAQHRDDDDHHRQQQQSRGHGPHHQGQGEVAGGHRRDRDLGRLADVVPQSGRAGEHLAAQGPSLVQRQELELDPRVARAGDLDGDLGHGEEPREERLGHVDGLEPAQLEASLLLGDHARVHPEVAVVVEPEPQVAPRQVLPAGDERRQHDDRPERRPGRQLSPIADSAPVPKTNTATAAMGSAVTPCTTGEIGCTWRRPDSSTRPLPGRCRPRPRSSPTFDGTGGGSTGSGGAHSPADRCSPRLASRSRRAAAASGSRPGDARVGGRGGRVQLDGGDAQPPVDRPGLHVDELHAAVGHDHEAAEHDAAGHEQVVVALRVAERPHATADEPPQPHEDDDGRRPRPIHADDPRHARDRRTAPRSPATTSTYTSTRVRRLALVSLGETGFHPSLQENAASVRSAMRQAPRCGQGIAGGRFSNAVDSTMVVRVDTFAAARMRPSRVSRSAGSGTRTLST